MQDKPQPQTKKDSVMANSGNYGTNYTLFQWTQGQWVVYQNCCDYGCVPAPPIPPGEYDGQIIPTGCVAMPKSV